MTRVVVTGLGIVSAAGTGLEANRQAIQEGRSGLGRLTRFPSPRCGHFPVAEVDGVDRLPGFPRTVALGRVALREALASAGLDGEAGEARELLRRAGIAAGTCVGGMPETEAAVEGVLAGQMPDPSVWLHHECAFTTHALAGEWDIRGPAMTISNACSSGAQAIASAADLLLAGEAKVAVAGGVDAITRLTLNGFASLLVMDPQGCRPFDRHRKGMSLGEGAAFLVLEEEGHALHRGARALAVLAGSANTCDAFHPTAPDPEGRGAEEAMRQALARAGIDPSGVDYVNAHGTGTPENDRAEGRALARVFGERAPPVSSTKRVFGHTLAAAGAIEAVVSVLALVTGVLPGTCGLSEADPECVIQPLAESLRAAPRVVLSNSFGFGGNNTVLCFTAMGGRS